MKARLSSRIEIQKNTEKYKIRKTKTETRETSFYYRVPPIA